VRLTVQEAAWREHVGATANAFPGLVPVVKGNGYGFGRARLAALATQMLVTDTNHISSGTVDTHRVTTLAVGTVHEVAEVPDAVIPLVLTPAVGVADDATLPPGLRHDTVLTIGADHHVDALAACGWTGQVVLKCVSSMRRYGTADLAGLLTRCTDAGLEPVGAALHLPLAGDTADHVAEIAHWFATADAHLPAGLPLDISHLDAASYAMLRDSHAHRPLRIRLGTSLWHGDKSFLHLGASVVDVHPVSAGDRLGYRASTCAVDGHVVLVAAGSAHGVQPLDGGLSPFHFARTRLALLEPPHMHTSMVVVPDGDPLPRPGDLLDLQRPLIVTQVDEVIWS
jgi:alanine racemase